MPTTSRLEALDVFRGLTVAGMLLVNDPGTWSAIYPPLEHAEWFGWTPTDLIFPFFLFIVGITTQLSFASRRARGDDDAKLVKQVLRRGGLILLIGLLMTGFPYHQFYITLPGGWVFDSRTPHLDVAHWRVTGVLQRIALCYTAAALLTLRTSVKQQVAIIAALLLGYWFVMTVVPVPGGFGPGALTLHVPDGSIAAWLDRTVIGTDHMWVGSHTWDPEGILSTFPAIGTTMLGSLTGLWIRDQRPIAERLNAIFSIGAIAMMAGLMWHWSFPIAKNIWTSSYVLFTGGMAAVALATCMWLIDIRQIRWWIKPWVAYGLNPIVAFVASGFLARLLYTLVKVPTASGLVPLETAIFNAVYLPLFSDPRDASLLFAVSYVMLFLGILWILYRKNIVVKV